MAKILTFNGWVDITWDFAAGPIAQILLLGSDKKPDIEWTDQLTNLGGKKVKITVEVEDE